MRDAEQVRRFLRAEQRDLLGTALLLTGDRTAADDLVVASTARALRRGGAARLTAEAVRDEMATRSAAGVRTDQVLDAGLTSGPDDDLAPLAAALDDLPARLRTVAVLRLADDVPLHDVARMLALPEDEVAAAEREALAALAPAAGDADLLPWRLDALAAVVPDDTAADRAADAVLAGRRRRRTTAVLAAAALVAAVPLTVAVLDRPADPADPAVPTTSTEPSPEPRPRSVDVLVAPPRGSLADDEEFLQAARRVPWDTDDNPPVADRTVVYATDTRAGRVALVVADTPSGLDGAWLIGPPQASVEELRPWVPAQIGRNRPAAVLVEGFGRAAVVVVAAPGDAVEISPRLLSEQSGALRREWTTVRADDGTAVVEVAGPEVGRSAAVRVLRDGRVAARPAIGVPGAGGRIGPFELEPLRRGTADADPALVGEAAARIALPFGVGVDALSTELLWSGELTRTGGLGSVVVLAARVPGNAHVVTAFGRLGSVRGGLEVPCGTTSFPAELPPSIVTVATVCSVFDGSDAGADRTWLVVTAPGRAAAAVVLDGGGRVLDRMSVVAGGAMTRTPDTAEQVRVEDADGRTLDVVPIAPAPEAPFGDYGDD
jgi:DNA-directed RNA polymerase specialized sigma24 family protein